jgi:hypothetical protein
MCLEGKLEQIRTENKQDDKPQSGNGRRNPSMKKPDADDSLLPHVQTVILL